MFVCAVWCVLLFCFVLVAYDWFDLRCVLLLVVICVFCDVWWWLLRLWFVIVMSFVLDYCCGYFVCLVFG